MRERGLKQYTAPEKPHLPAVAPYAGAWIETLWAQAGSMLLPSLSMWERGLKLV